MHRVLLRVVLVVLAVASFAVATSVMPAGAASDPTGGCPRVAVDNSGSRPAGPLVPGRPVSVHLCRYGSDVGPGAFEEGTFVGYGDVADRATVARITRSMNRLPRPPRGIRVCPADDGSKIVATFRYRTGRQLSVVVDRSGCRDVHRGTMHRDGLQPPGPTLLRLLDSLVALR